MFRQSLILGILSGVVSGIISIVYCYFYYSNLFDFSEAMNYTFVLSTNVLIGSVAGMIYAVLNKLIFNWKIRDFVFNVCYVVASLGMVLVVLGMDDPQFTDTFLKEVTVFYKGFLMPLVFLPVLTWFVLKPLFSKKYDS